MSLNALLLVAVFVGAIAAYVHRTGGWKALASRWLLKDLDE